MGRHSHDHACAIAGQDIVRGPDGQVVACERVDGIRSGENTCFFAVGGQAINFGNLTGFGNIAGNITLAAGCCQGLAKLTFRGNNHIGCAHEGVSPGGEDGQAQGFAGIFIQQALAVLFHLKGEFSTFRAADPVDLDLLCLIGPVQLL